MGKIFWIFAVIGLRSVQSSCPISACLAAVSKTGYLEEDSVAPGNSRGTGYRWQLLWATKTLQREGENVLPSSFIRPCKKNWNKMLSVLMMWVRSTCHRRCELSEIWGDCSGAEKEEKGAEEASVEAGKEEPVWRDEAGWWDNRCVEVVGEDRAGSQTGGPDSFDLRRAWQTEWHSL